MRSLTLRPGHSLPSFRWFRRWASELWFPAALPSKLRGVWLLPRWDCLPLNTSAFAGRTLRVLSPGAHSPLARQGRARRPANRAAGARHDHHDSRSRRLTSSLHPAGGLTQPNPFTTLGPVLASGCSRPHPQRSSVPQCRPDGPALLASPPVYSLLNVPWPVARVSAVVKRVG